MFLVFDLLACYVHKVHENSNYHCVSHYFKLDAQQTTFDEVTEKRFAMTINDAGQRSRVDIVFDSYRAQSIKNLERSNEGGG
jgi:hypothetical protein